MRIRWSTRPWSLYPKLANNVSRDEIVEIPIKPMLFYPDRTELL